MSKTIELAKKLKALSDKGVGGEKLKKHKKRTIQEAIEQQYETSK